MSYTNKRPSRQNSSASASSDTPLVQQHQQQPILQHQLSSGSNYSVSTGLSGFMATEPATEDTTVSLAQEISDVMRSFGDCERPRPESVLLVQQILQQQLRGIFNEAMRRKNGACPTQADFEFLMRKHPVKIARMRKHLKDMKILKKFLILRIGMVQDDKDVNDSDEELSIDVPELFDEERTRRLFRADRISNILNGQQYLEFNEARKTSFYCRHGEKMKNKFRQFLKFPPDMQIPMTVMNILAYFAHETIAVIVDHAILTRLNSENRITDPYARVTSTGASSAMMHICPEVTQGRGQEVVRPILPAEIYEGIRRFQQMTTKKIGFYRSNCDNDLSKSFLAC